MSRKPRRTKLVEKGAIPPSPATNLGSAAAALKLPQQVITEPDLDYAGQGGTHSRDSNGEASEIRDRYDESADHEEHARPPWEHPGAYDREPKEHVACNPGQHAGDAYRDMAGAEDLPKQLGRFRSDDRDERHVTAEDPGSEAGSEDDYDERCDPKPASLRCLCRVHCDPSKWREREGQPEQSVRGHPKRVCTMRGVFAGRMKCEAGDQQHARYDARDRAPRKQLLRLTIRRSRTAAVSSARRLVFGRQLGRPGKVSFPNLS